MKVSELMTKDPAVTSPETTLAAAIAVMDERSVRHLPVVERGRLIGIISERDLLDATGWSPGRYVEADGGPKVVRDSMSVPVETARRDDHVRAAIGRLLDRRIDCLPVVDDQERLVGILTVVDLGELVRKRAAVGSSGELDAVVGAYMSETPRTADVGATVADAIALCRELEVRHLPVVSDGWFVGVVSDRDLRLRAGRGEDERRLGEIMSTDLITVGPDDQLSEAVDLMHRRRVDSVVVTRDGRMVGVLTKTDVLRLLRDRLDPDWE